MAWELFESPDVIVCGDSCAMLLALVLAVFRVHEFSPQVYVCLYACVCVCVCVSIFIFIL